MHSSVVFSHGKRISTRNVASSQNYQPPTSQKSLGKVVGGEGRRAEPGISLRLPASEKAEDK